jgi:surface carbohydrate biosynthesis protein (TIGR04326 family)
VSKKVIIIESDLNIDVNLNSVIILWNKSKHENSNFFSLPLFVEENAEFYKTKFLEWISALSRSKVNSKNLEAYYEINKGLSFFWLTSLGQRCNIIESSQINTAIKLLALEDVFKKHQFDEVELISEDIGLINTLRDFCFNNNLKFTQPLFKNYKLKISSIFYIPQFLISISYLVYFILIRWLRYKKPKIKQENSSVIFFDMFINIKKQNDDSQYFDSHYWTILPKMLQTMSIPVTWTHFFYRHKAIPNIRIAEQIKIKLNAISSIQNHSIIDSFLSFKIIFSAFFQYVKIYSKTLMIWDKKNLFNQKHITGFNFFFLFRNEFFDSCYGVDAIRTSLYFSLIDNYLSKISFKKVGFYIQENQPWETILLNVWKKYNHGVIIGIPHSTVRYWDLRYFYDSSIYNKQILQYFPLPDFIAVNGPVAEQNLKFNQASLTMVKQVEALRYLHLKSHKASNNSTKKVKKILMCGDFLSSTNKKMISCLKEAVGLLNSTISISVKPHPGTPIPVSFYNNFEVTIRTEALQDLINEFDLIFTSNISSSAVDVYISGKFLVQFIDWKYFNMSPLRGVYGIPYVSTAQEFVSIINEGCLNSEDFKQDFFFTDTNLVKWNQLIETYCKSSS